MAMNHTDPDEDSVLISLSVGRPADINYPERRFHLTETRPTLQIGRSSTRSTVNLQPAVTNGWFNSPVMSRHHAEITADIPNKAVTIRDSGSMHGTFLNFDRVSCDKPQPFRAGDELIFGMPVYRHDTNFEPAKVMVERVEFRNASRPTTSPTRVFTVPDDCSTDDNEPIDEEPLPSSSKGPTVIDLEEIPYTPRSPRSSVPQLDGVIDLVSAPSDAEDESSNSGDGDGDDDQGFHSGLGFRRRFTADHSEDDEESLRLTNDEMSSAPGSPVDSVDLSDTPHLTNHSVDSPSPSWNSSSSNSDNDDMDMDEDENDDSDHASEGDFLLHDLDSDEEDAMRDVLDFVPDSEQEESMAVPPQPPVSQSYPRWLPPLNSVIPPGQWGHLTFERPRLPSPSDAVLPHGNRRLETGDLEQSSNKPERAVPEAKTGANPGQATADILGQKSGKPDFFEAREHNKMTIARLTEQSSRPTTPAFHDVPTKQGPCLHLPLDGWKVEGLESEATITKNEARIIQHQLDIVAPLVPSSNPAHDESGSGPESAPLRMRQPQRANGSSPHGQPSWVDFEPSDWAPASAYELQQEKQRMQRRNKNLQEVKQLMRQMQAQNVQAAFPGSLPLMDNNVAKEHVNILSSPDTLNATNLDEAHEAREDSLATEAQKENKGKRKADLLSEVTEADIGWTEFYSPDVVSETQFKDSPAATTSDASLLFPPPSPGPTSAQSRLPSPPTTPEAVANPEARPAKRIKKIAERVGYAALGGATVGAMVLTSLIYSAPTFV